MWTIASSSPNRCLSFSLYVCESVNAVWIFEGEESKIQ